jgi:hypothetical protein
MLQQINIFDTINFYQHYKVSYRHIYDYFLLKFYYLLHRIYQKLASNSCIITIKLYLVFFTNNYFLLITII